MYGRFCLAPAPQHRGGKFTGLNPKTSRGQKSVWAGWLAGWLAGLGWAGWLIGLLAGWLADWLAELVGQLAGWLGWLSG